MIKMSKEIFFFCVITLFSEFTVYTRSACIIIHGTWAKNESWYQPEGDFFYEIEIANQYLGLVDEVVSFSWSGKLGDLAQREAGQQLAEKILGYDFVILIGHSHGVTVGIQASLFLGKINTVGKNFSKIKKFYALGVPVDKVIQMYPDMSVVDNFYNLFSFGDLIQCVHGLYDRCFKASDNITNIAVRIDDLHPSHSQLHHPVIAKHLLAIPDFYQRKKIGNFENFINNHPAEIFFFSKKNLYYQFQNDQSQRLETDKLAFELMQYAFFRSKKNLFKD
ncbi:hypothetical protein HYV10_01710 [Candidatus Dependentiae bacterium]|nr:hypothetical protein [Candidatus Dependentiae bacterium]